MLYGVTINGKNTLREWGLILLNDLKIEEPVRKSNVIDIPGADGELDLSNAPQGRAVYKNRKISFTLFKAVGEAELEALRTELRSAFHGKTVKLKLPNELQNRPTHYYRGVLSVETATGYNRGRIPISVSAYPYKLRDKETSIGVMVRGSTTFILQNEYRPVAPRISTTAEITIAWGSSSASLSAGEDWIVPSLVLEPGDNEIIITGTADVFFRYQEGCL